MRRFGPGGCLEAIKQNSWLLQVQAVNGIVWHVRVIAQQGVLGYRCSLILLSSILSRIQRTKGYRTGSGSDRIRYSTISKTSEEHDQEWPMTTDSWKWKMLCSSTLAA